MKLDVTFARLIGLIRGHPLWAVFTGFVSAVALYDTCSGWIAQLTDWTPPSLRTLFGWSFDAGSSLLPWWGWLLVLLVILNVAQLLDRWMSLPTPQVVSQQTEPEAMPASVSGQIFPPTVTQDNLSPALYLAQVSPELSHLEDRSVLRLALLCFNGSGRPMRFGSGIGSLEFGPWPPGGALQRLPLPHVMFEEGQDLTPAFGQFFIFIECSVSHEVAQRMRSFVMDRGFEIDFTGLSILLQPVGDPEAVVHLSLWESARIATSPDHIGGWRNHRASMNVSLTASGSAG